MTSLRLRDRTLALEPGRPLIMGIVNANPDSFSDARRLTTLDAQVAEALAQVAAGADIIDVGGESGVTHTAAISAQEEIERVLPLVERLVASEVTVSVDTWKPEVAEAALAAGASMINDVSGLRDPAIADAVAGTDAALVITHSLAAPRTLHPSPQYADVVAEVTAFLRSRVELALSRGVRPDQIIVDPGHDLNKNTHHSLELTRRLREITALGYPTLAALSNKDFIGETLDRPQQERLVGTVAAVVFCVAQGARIVRVHDVRAAVDAVRMTEAMLGWREPAYTRHNI